MLRLMKVIPWWLSIVAAAVPLIAQQSRVEKRMIQAARRIPASRLEPGLSNQPFDRWFAGAMGRGATIQWEINDCGEQTGDPQVDGPRDIPLCVAATANLADGRVASVLIFVGSENKGVTRTPRFIRWESRWTSGSTRSGN